MVWQVHFDEASSLSGSLHRESFHSLALKPMDTYVNSESIAIIICKSQKAPQSETTLPTCLQGARGLCRGSGRARAFSVPLLS